MSTPSNSALLQPEAAPTDEQLISEMESLVAERQRRRVSRRGFLAGASLVGAAGLAGCSNGSSNTGVTTPAPTASSPSVGDVLNFALNLEYLEATFYLTVTGANGTTPGLQAADMGANPGAVTGGVARINFTNADVLAAALELAADEQAHVQFLRATMQALNLNPVDMPALNLAALGAVTNDYQFLNVARALETTGVSAYEGGVQLLASNLTALDYATNIHATESQHESLLRELIIAHGPGFATNNVTLSAVDSGDTVPYVAGSGGAAATLNIFNTNATTGLYTTRNTSQVLMIVYGNTNAGITSGGFYPNGLNGNIKST